LAFRVRLLSPAFTRMRRVSTGPGSGASENRCARSTSARSASHHPVTIVGPAPRVLSLTPQVAFSFSIGRPRFRCLPHIGSYCGLPRSSPGSPAPSIGSLNPRRLLPFSYSGCDAGTFWRLVVRPKPPGKESPHWLTVATIGMEPTVFALKARNPGPGGITRLRGWFHRSVPLLVRITDRGRSPPGFLVVVAGRQSPP
jgi:hypothetical protein